MHVSKKVFLAALSVINGKTRSYLVRIGIVEVLPGNEATLASSKGLQLLGVLLQHSARASLGIGALDCNVEQEHDRVLANEIETEDVAAALGAVLGEDSGNGLEHALCDEVVVGVLCLPLVDKLLVSIDDVLEDLGIVLEVHGEPDITVRQ